MSAPVRTRRKEDVVPDGARDERLAAPGARTPGNGLPAVGGGAPGAGGGPDGGDDDEAVRRAARHQEPSPSPLIAACVAAAMCLEQLLDASSDRLDERAEPVRWAFDALHDLLDLTPRPQGFVPPRSSLPSPRQLARELAAWEWGTLRHFRCLEADECFAVYQAIVGNGGGFVVLTFGGLYLPTWLQEHETVLRRRTVSAYTGDAVETHAAVVSLSSPVLRHLAEWAPPVKAALAALPPVWPAERERRSAPGPRTLADGPRRVHVERD